MHGRDFYRSCHENKSDVALLTSYDKSKVRNFLLYDLNLAITRRNLLLQGLYVNWVSWKDVDYFLGTCGHFFLIIFFHYFILICLFGQDKLSGQVMTHQVVG